MATATSVSKRAWLVVAILAVALLGGVLYRNVSRAVAPAPTGAAKRAATPTAAPPGTRQPERPATARVPEHVVKLANAAERRAIADRIAAGRATRAQQTPPRPPTLPSGEPDTRSDLERASPKLKVALEEAIPLLAECYKSGGPVTQRRPAVHLTLTTAPDVGTLVSTDELFDQDGKRLDPELDSCLRTTLGSMLLPPLGIENDLPLQYSFNLDDG